MKKILVTHKKLGDSYALIDDQDYDLVSKYKWSLNIHISVKYPRCNFYINGKRTSIYMHKLLCPNFKVVDHINGNGLDNRRSNLRQATILTNNRNARKRKSSTCTSKYKGVRKQIYHNSWNARITVNKLTINLGSFNTELEAAKAYNEAAIKYFGEFACLNQI